MQDSSAPDSVSTPESASVLPLTGPSVQVSRAESNRASTPTLDGVDVSSYQGAIDWRAVRADGIRFAFIKASEGTEVADRYFEPNWAGCREVGVQRIAYHFFYDWLGGVTQCEYHHAVVRERGRYRYGEAGALDVEEASVTNAATCIAEAQAYIRAFWMSVNKPLIIYTNYDTWHTMLGDPDYPEFRACPLWLADIGAYIPPLKAWPTGLSFWQYSWTGRVSGIPSAVDLDRFYGTPAELSRIMRVVPRIG